MKIISGGIAAPKGFLACGLNCGIKFKKRDLALIYSQRPCVASGLFTQNRIQAAPLKVTQGHIRNHRAQAVIINSGNANCCTGRQGIADARKICTALAKKLSIDLADVLVASTGIIGKRLPVERIESALGALIDGLAHNAGLTAAQAIMTTDTKVKQIAVKLTIGKKTVTIGGMAKGAGMIHPHLATMLAFIATDIVITKNRLQAALQEAADNSFNLISVDGDTSTNDMVLGLANGLAQNTRLSTKEFKLFQKALNYVCLSLAKMIVQDAEGATKFVEIQVAGARSFAQAKKIAFSVANSPLVKTALFGSNPNWGRIAASVGCADRAVRADRLNIYLGAVKVLQKGTALKADRRKLRQIFQKKEIAIKVDLGIGNSSAKVFTCDLSEEYVRINARY